MFNVTLMRNDQPQDTIEVMVMKPYDERFFKRNAIQIALVDDTFKISAVATLPDGRIVTEEKVAGNMTDLFERLSTTCQKVLDTPKIMH